MKMIQKKTITKATTTSYTNIRNNYRRKHLQFLKANVKFTANLMPQTV